MRLWWFRRRFDLLPFFWIIFWMVSFRLRIWNSRSSGIRRSEALIMHSLTRILPWSRLHHHVVILRNSARISWGDLSRSNWSPGIKRSSFLRKIFLRRLLLRIFFHICNLSWTSSTRSLLRYIFLGDIVLILLIFLLW